jgi:hypothetical protein
MVTEAKTPTLTEMLKQTLPQANQIVRGETHCPICSVQPMKWCVCYFYQELVKRYRDIPEKYKPVLLMNLKASEKSRLPMIQQTELYDEMRANPTSGWAFFSPAGYSKTTCSIALYKKAIFENLRRSWELVPNRCETAADRLYVWRKSVPDLFAQHFERFNNPNAPLPDITVEKIEQGKRRGFTPRVFLEEIDKQKPSEFTTHQLFRLFDALDRHKCQIVLDSNLSKAQFAEIFGEPIVRRIKENCIVKEYGC